MALAEDHEALLDLEEGRQHLSRPREQGQLTIGLEEHKRRTDQAGRRPDPGVRGSQELLNGGALAFVVRGEPLLGDLHVPARLLGHRAGVVSGPPDDLPVRREVALHEPLRVALDLAARTPRGVDRRPRQPGLDRLLEVGTVRHGLLDPAKGRAGTAPRLLERCQVTARRPKRDTVSLLEPEQHLDLAQLRTLESARGHQLVAESEVGPRGDRLDDLEVRHGDPEDRRDAPEPLHGAGQLLLGDTGRHEQITRAPQVPQDQLEPELIDLMNGDEQRLLVRDLLVLSGEPLLKREEFFNSDVVPVGRR